MSSCWPKEFVSLQGLPNNTAQVRAKMRKRKGKTGNKIENHDWPDSIYNPVEIHLQYLPDPVLLARAWHHTRPQTEDSSSAFALAGLQPIAHASRGVGRGQSLKVVQQNANIRKDFAHKSSNDLSKSPPS